MYTSQQFRSFRKQAEEALFDQRNTDNMKDVDAEWNRGNEDTRSYLKHIFTNASAFGDNTNKTIKKLFPTSGDVQGGNPFIKIAQHTYRFSLRETPILKEASLGYKEVVFLGFTKELEKIAGIPGKVAGIPGQTLGQLKMKNGIGQLHGKTWDISGAASPQTAASRPVLAPAVTAMREAAAKRSSNPGLLQRVGGWFGK